METAVVLGAGITGLTTAWKLAESSRYHVEVLEIQPRIGGLSTTIQKGALKLDLGPHKIYTQLPGVMEEVRELIGDQILQIPKKSSIRLQGKFFSYPFKVTDLITGLDPLLAIRLVGSYAVTKARYMLRSPADNSYEEYLVSRFGRGLYSLVFQPQAEKIWGDPRKLAADLARIRVPFPGLKEVLIRALFGTRNRPELSADQFYYPRDGIGTLSEEMAARIEKKGGIVHLGARPTSLRVEHDRVRSVSYKEDGAERVIEAAYVISTIPLPELVGLLEPRPAGESVQAAYRLRYRPVVLTYLVTKRNRATNDCWIFFPERKYAFNRSFEQRMFSEEMVPTDLNVVCTDTTCEYGDEIWHSSDQEIYEKVVEGLEEAGLLSRDHVIEHFTIKARYAYPVYELDYHRNLTIVLEMLDHLGNLYTSGRLGLFNYSNMDHCIDMGCKLARFILSGKEGGEIWQSVRESFSSYQIVD